MSTSSRKNQSAAPPRTVAPFSGGRAWIVIAAVLFAAALSAVGYYRILSGDGYPLDDSWIHLTFARNIASGAGFGANPGEPTPGATSPLWVFLLAPGFLFGAAHAVWPWLLAALVLGGAALLYARLVIALSAAGGAATPWLAVACGVGVAWTGPLVWSAAGAMEVPLFAALVAATLLAFARGGRVARGGRGRREWRRGIAWGALAGASALARPEGLLLAVIVVVIALSRRGAWVEALCGAGACAVVYAPSVAFCLATNGRIFPNTFYAKTTALVAGAPDASFLQGTARFMMEASPLALLALIAGLAGLVATARARRDLRSPVAAAAFAVGLPMAYAAMGRTFLFTQLAGNFDRYLYPMLPVSLALGCWAAGAWLDGQRGARRRAVTTVIVGGIVILSAVGVVQRAGLFRHNVDDINSMQVAMAKRLQSRAAPGSLVAANDVGAIAYFTDFRILDLVGIISTATLRKLEATPADPRSRHNAFLELLREEKPDVIVVFPRWFAPTLRALSLGLEPIEDISNPNNITSGWPRLVAFKVDWTKL